MRPLVFFDSKLLSLVPTVWHLFESRTTLIAFEFPAVFLASLEDTFSHLFQVCTPAAHFRCQKWSQFLVTTELSGEVINYRKWSMYMGKEQETSFNSRRTMSHSGTIMPAAEERLSLLGMQYTPPWHIWESTSVGISQTSRDVVTCIHWRVFFPLFLLSLYEPVQHQL